MNKLKGQIYHVEINVSDFEKSVMFYEAFLGWLGYERIYTHKIAAGWGIKGAELATNFWIIQGHAEHVRHGYHRKRVGMNHVAFHADSRETVDQFYREHLLPNRIPVLYGGPKEYPEYSKGYYSVYFEDPDRIKLELAHVPQNLHQSVPASSTVP
ncbi:MAG TPA: VOC family protein [Candidatus Bathyarchaeia archaeon]|nr:VOC family protein [Candidatus Bathyarchaeia archaeon]